MRNFAAMIVATVLSIPAAAREHAWIVSSASAAPLVEALADGNAERSPVILTRKSDEAIAEFCAGNGPAHTDAVAVARDFSDLEWTACRSAGVTDIAQLEFGLDATVLMVPAGSPARDLTLAQLASALAAERPGALAFGPARTWRDVDPGLPELPLRPLLPPLESATADVLTQLVLLPVCGNGAAAPCGGLRRDAAVPGAGDLRDLLRADRGGLSTVGYGYAQTSGPDFRMLSIDGVAPTADAIADGRYPLVRRLRLYVKTGNIAGNPGLAAFMRQAADRVPTLPSRFPSIVAPRP